MRTFSILCAAVLLLGLSGCVSRGVVWRVDHWDKTVTIDDQTYQVTDATRFYGADGRRIGLDDVPSGADPRVGIRSLARAEVDFRRVPGADEPTLETVWVRSR